jgi:hypothetical protein
MKTYRVSRLYRFSLLAAKVVFTGLAGALYYAAVSHPTPLPTRLALLAGIALFGWLFYVHMPKVPMRIDVGEDGLIEFKSRRGTTAVKAADIQSIGRTFSRRTVRVNHAGGQVRVPNRFKKLVDFLLTVKGLNPSIDMVGF